MKTVHKKYLSRLLVKPGYIAEINSRYIRDTARLIAEARVAAKESPIGKNKRTALDPVAMHETGLLAEIMFGDLFNLHVNTSVTSHGDAGYDFVLSNGWTVDVKARLVRLGGSYRSFDLMVMPERKDKEDPDIWVHVVIPKATLKRNCEQVFLVGYADKSMLFRTDYGHGPARAVLHEKVLDIQNLLDIHNRGL